MTQVAASTLPTQLAMPVDSGPATNIGSIISSLANVSSEKVGAFADKAFLAMGKDGVKFLPFLTALVRAFQGNGSGSTSGAQSAQPKGVDIGAATKALIDLRTANPDLKGLDAAVSKISSALPQLTQGQFDSLLDSIKSAVKPGATGDDAAKKGEIDSLELSLLQAQIDAAKTSNSASAASPTGNAALDAVLGAIQDLAKDGITSEEGASLAQIFASLLAALLPPEKGEDAMKALMASLGMAPPRGQPSGLAGPVSQPVSQPAVQPSLQISIGFGSDALAANSLARMSNPPSNLSGGFQLGGRGHSFDGMFFLKQSLQQSAALSGFDPSATSTLAYTYLLNALNDSVNRSTSGQNLGAMATTM